MNIVHVILSGGVGSRLWPMSRKSMPKQYIPIFNGKSLFQITAERNKSSAEKTIIVGNRENYLLSRLDLQRANISEFIELNEFLPRNTAAAIAFAAFAANVDDILLITPSDHIINNNEQYQIALKEAFKLADEGFLVTFGVNPTKPETGYGYIEYSGNDVLSFREKPDQQTAQSFIGSGNFLWNSGMFCFRADTYLAELSSFEPSIYDAAKLCFDKCVDGFLPENESRNIPSQSIDYAVMERSKKIKVVQANFEWSDLGSFESIWEYWKTNGEEHRFVQNNCVIGSKKHVEFLGVSNVVFIETEDAILVLDKSKSQEVKKIYERLEREFPSLVE